MHDPLHPFGTAGLGTILLTALVAVVCIGRLIRALGPPAGTPGPLALELPRTRDHAVKIIDAWKGRNAVGAARRAIYADFAFLVAYGVATAAAGSLVGRALVAWADPSDRTSAFRLIVYAGLAAPVLDVIENVLMLAMLKGHTDQPVPAITTAVSGLKWLILVLAILAAVVLFVVALIS